MMLTDSLVAFYIEILNVENLIKKGSNLIVIRVVKFYPLLFKKLNLIHTEENILGKHKNVYLTSDGYANR